MARTLHVQVKLNNSLLLLSISKSIVDSSQGQDSYSKLFGKHKALFNVADFTSLMIGGMGNSIDARNEEYFSLGI